LRTDQPAQQLQANPLSETWAANLDTMEERLPMVGSAHPVLLYDGVCGLCNRVVQFVLRRERAPVFRFAALQSPFAARILQRHKLQGRGLDTLVVVLNINTESEKLLFQSDGALNLLRQLRQPWSFLAGLGMLFPRAFRESGYRYVASRRYRLFGKSDSCALPAPDVASRFLDTDLVLPTDASFPPHS